MSLTRKVFSLASAIILVAPMVLIVCISKTKNCGRNQRLTTVQSKLSGLRLSDEFERSWVRSGIKGKISHTIFSLSDKSIQGLKSTVQLTGDQDLLEVPWRSSLSVSKSDDVTLSRTLGEIWKIMREDQRLGVKLLMEWKLGESSQFKDYINHLPPPGTLDTPLHWESADVDGISYSYMVNSVAYQNESLHQLFQNMSGSSAMADISFERFVWAMEMVMSRAFTGAVGSDGGVPLAVGMLGIALTACLIFTGILKDETQTAIAAALSTLISVPAVIKSNKESLVLLPAIDSSNHHSTAFNAMLSSDPVKKAFILRCSRSTNEGDQVFISYGEKSNDDLLQYFGFVEPNNPWDRYSFRVSKELVATVLARASSNSEGVDEIGRLLEGALGHAAGERLGRITVTRRPIDTWALGPFSKSFQGSTPSVKQCQSLLLAAEREKVFEGMQAADGGGASNTRSRTRLVHAFLSEKLSVIDCAIASLQR